MSDKVFDRRFARHREELQAIFRELWKDDAAFDYFKKVLQLAYKERDPELKARDALREADPNWYRQNDNMGMMFYIDNFAGNLQGVRQRISYLKECQVNYIHLMPFLKSPEGRSDGGYAVADFRQVEPRLGTMEDLSELTRACHAS